MRCFSLNPYLIIGALLAVIGSAAIGYSQGAKHATAAAKAAHADAMDRALTQARENAVIDMQAAAEAAEARQQVRVQFVDRIKTVQQVIREHAPPADCRLPDPAIGLLNDAIGAANAAASAKPQPVPAAADAGKR